MSNNIRNPESRRLRGKIAAATRFAPEKVPALQRDLRASNLEQTVRETLAAAPPLTVEQRQRIARLLSGGAA